MATRDPYNLGIPYRRPVTSIIGGSNLGVPSVKRATGIFSDEPIVPSAAAQYMAAQERDRRALAESTRTQQGQIPQMPQVQVPQAGRRVPTGMADRKALTGSQQDVGTQQDGGFLSKLYADPSSARGKALQAAAATALQLSGYQNKPVTTGEVLGAMMQSGMGAYGAEEARQQDLMLAMAQLGAKKDGRDLVTLYDEQGGQYKAFYDPTDPNADAQGYVQVGGTKPQSGMSITTDAEGNVTFTQGFGSGVALEKGVKKDLQKDLVKINQNIASLESIQDQFDPSYLTVPTKISNWIASTGERLSPRVMSLFNYGKEDYDKASQYYGFIAGVQEKFSATLKELSGAAVTKFELDNARRFLPDVNDSPTQFQAKLRNAIGIQTAARYRASALLSGGKTITDDLAREYPLSLTRPDANGDPKTMYIHEYVKAFDGSTDEAIKSWQERAAE